MISEIGKTTLSATALGTLTMILLSMPAFGFVALTFGAIALPVIACLSFFLSSLLLYLRRKHGLAPLTFFVACIGTGTVTGAVVPMSMTGYLPTAITVEVALFHGSYALLGAASSFGGWLYARTRPAM